MEKVDWSRPIEAYHPDGRVGHVPMAMGDGMYTIRWKSGDSPYEGTFDEYGWPVANWDWRIRNVAQPAGEAPLLSPEIVGRMVALVREIAAWTWAEGTSGREDLAEARAILAELEPVDGDEAHVRSLIEQWGDDETPAQLAMRAVKLGRELERGA